MRQQEGLGGALRQVDAGEAGQGGGAKSGTHCCCGWWQETGSDEWKPVAGSGFAAEGSADRGTGCGCGWGWGKAAAPQGLRRPRAAWLPTVPASRAAGHAQFRLPSFQASGRRVPSKRTAAGHPGAARTGAWTCSPSLLCFFLRLLIALVGHLRGGAPGSSWIHVLVSEVHIQQDSGGEISAAGSCKLCGRPF